MAVTLLSLTPLPGAKAWEVDFSRRQMDFSRIKNQSLLEVKETKEESFFSPLITPAMPTQDVVILNTEKGFVPESLFLKKNQNYRLHVVNIHPKEKSLSFIMESFSEHHGTAFAEQKTFEVTPKIDGIFTYQCPETGIEGRLVVSADTPSGPNLMPPGTKSPLPLSVPQKAPLKSKPVLSEPLTLRVPATARASATSKSVVEESKSEVESEPLAP
jgi:hypothetical protein